jgi:hypothetical protein
VERLTLSRYSGAREIPQLRQVADAPQPFLDSGPPHAQLVILRPRFRGEPVQDPLAQLIV